MFAAHAERLAAGCEHGNASGMRRGLGHERRDVAEEMLAIVEDQQQRLPLQEPRQTLDHRQTLRRRISNRRRDGVMEIA